MSIQQHVDDLSYIAAAPTLDAVGREVAKAMDGYPIAICLTVLFDAVTKIFIQLRRERADDAELRRMLRDMTERVLQQITGEE